MYYILVKFSGYEPVVMGASHPNHIPLMTTMRNVEWVSPAISNGNIIGLDGEPIPGHFPNDDEVSVPGPDAELVQEVQPIERQNGKRAWGRGF